MTRCGARHHRRGNLARRRRLRHPWRAQFEVEVHRTGQTDRAKHVGEDVSCMPAHLAPDARASGPDAGQVAYTFRRAAKEIGRLLMALRRDLAVCSEHAAQ